MSVGASCGCPWLRCPLKCPDSPSPAAMQSRGAAPGDPCEAAPLPLCDSAGHPHGEGKSPSGISAPLTPFGGLVPTPEHPTHPTATGPYLSAWCGGYGGIRGCATPLGHFMGQQGPAGRRMSSELTPGGTVGHWVPPRWLAALHIPTSLHLVCFNHFIIARSRLELPRAAALSPISPGTAPLGKPAGLGTTLGAGGTLGCPGSPRGGRFTPALLRHLQKRRDRCPRTRAAVVLDGRLGAGICHRRTLSVPSEGHGWVPVVPSMGTPQHEA